MNEILGLVGTVCICGGFYLMARKEKENSERLQNRVNKLENENHDFWTANLKKNKEIKELKNEKEELHKTILFDNDVAIQRTEKLEQASNRFAKDQMTIADLNHELCEVNYKVVELESEVEGMVKRGFVKLERARLLGGVE